MSYKCVCGNVSKIVFYSFRRGNRCKFCGNKKCSKVNKTITHEIAVEYFKSQGCVLLDIYEKSCKPMNCICVCGKPWKCNWNNFKKGKRCKECLRVKRSGLNNYQWIENRELKKEYDSFKQRCYKMLKYSLKSFGLKKTFRTHKMLGYSSEELYKHISNHPNWNNLKYKRWHLDHIFPIKAFVDYDIKNFKIINGLDNLQPLLYKDNIAKSDKYDCLAFETWLKTKGINVSQD